MSRQGAFDGDEERQTDAPGKLSGAEAAGGYFTRNGLVRLLDEARRTYIRLGRIGGNAHLEAPTDAEQRGVRDLFGRQPRYDGQGRLQVRLADLDALLQKSRFACGLLDLFVAHYGEAPQSRAERRAASESEWNAFLDRVTHPQAGCSAAWLARLSAGDADQSLGSVAVVRLAFARADADHSALARDIRLVARALDSLPAERGEVRLLPVFANDVGGDPHLLDSDRMTGRLFEAALLEQSELALEDFTASERREALLLEAGLARDAYSSSVVTMGLDGARYSTGSEHNRLWFFSDRRVGWLPRIRRLRRVRWLQRARRDRVSVGLTLHELSRWQAITARGRTAYIVENPAVFAALHNAAVCPSGSLPILILGSGRPNLSVLRLVDLLVAGGARLHYAGDFDTAGLQIAAGLRRRRPELRLWRMTPDDYHHAAAGSPHRLNEAERAQLERLRSQSGDDALNRLAAAMLTLGAKAYQESLIDQYVADWRHRVAGGHLDG